MLKRNDKVHIKAWSYFPNFYFDHNKSFINMNIQETFHRATIEQINHKINDALRFINDKRI